MKNKLNIFLIASNVIIIALFLMSSTGILISTGTGNPDGSAMLEIKSSDKGLLIPRVDLDDISSNTSPVNAPTEGLLVYNDGGDQAEGFYYWDEDHDQWNSIVNEVKPVRYHLGSSVNIGSSGSSRINFNTQSFDENLSSPVTIGSNWVFTAPTDGYYNVSCRLYVHISTGTTAQLELRDGNTSGLISYLDVVTDKFTTSGNSSQFTLSGDDLVKMSKGDKFYLQLFANNSHAMYGGSNQCYVSISYEGN